jgi:hypothetical protein
MAIAVAGVGYAPAKEPTPLLRHAVAKHHRAHQAHRTVRKVIKTRRCEGVGAVPTAGGGCLTWVYR